MPSRFYFRPVSRGLGDLGAQLGHGLERGVESYEGMRSRRRAERRQDVEDERRHGFEDAAEARATAAEERLDEIHPYNLDRMRLGLDADRTDIALTGRQLGGGRYVRGMDLPEGTQRYGAIYGLTPEAERARDLDRLEPAVSLLSRGFGRDLTPEEVEGGARIGLDPMRLLDPTDEIGYTRAREDAIQRRLDDLKLTEYREGQQNLRQLRDMWPGIKLDTFGSFDEVDNEGRPVFTGWRATPEEMMEAEREYYRTGETPRELDSPQRRPPDAPALPTGLTAQDVEQAVPALFQLGPKSEREARRMLKREKFTDEQIEYILDAFEDYARAESRGRLHQNRGRQ